MSDPLNNVRSTLNFYLSELDKIIIKEFPGFSFPTEHLDNHSYVDEFLNQLPNSKGEYIYRISIDGIHNCQLVTERFHSISKDVESKSSKDKIGFSLARYNNCRSETLYVGSSTTGVKSRIKQHLGYGPSATYALHLSRWLHRTNLLLEIKIHQLQSMEGGQVRQAIVELIEQSFWDQYKPLFGKKSGR